MMKLNMQNVEKIIEAILMAAGRPMTPDQILKLFNKDKAHVDENDATTDVVDAVVATEGADVTAEAAISADAESEDGSAEDGESEGGSAEDDAPLFLTQDEYSPDDVISIAEVNKALSHLEKKYENHGFELKKVGTGYRFYVRAECSPWVGKLWDEKPQRYTRALLETLALIAYRQPITRGEIESIRGVAVSSNIIRTLEDHGWVRVVGHKDVPGRPALLATTKFFLDHFNLSTLDELPPLSEVRDLDQIAKDIDAEHVKAIEEMMVAQNAEAQVDNEISDDELSDNEISDNEISDDEILDNEISDNELSDNEISDNEELNREVVNVEMKDSELQDGEMQKPQIQNVEVQHVEIQDTEVQNSELQDTEAQDTEAQDTDVQNDTAASLETVDTINSEAPDFAIHLGQLRARHEEDSEIDADMHGIKVEDDALPSMDVLSELLGDLQNNNEEEEAIEVSSEAKIDV